MAGLVARFKNRLLVKVMFPAGRRCAPDHLGLRSAECAGSHPQCSTHAGDDGRGQCAVVAIEAFGVGTGDGGRRHDFWEYARRLVGLQSATLRSQGTTCAGLNTFIA